MKLITVFILAILHLLSAFGSKKETENNAYKRETNEKITSTTTTTSSNEKATVSFKVNGVEANTKNGGGYDNTHKPHWQSRYWPNNNFFTINPIKK